MSRSTHSGHSLSHSAHGQHNETMQHQNRIRAATTHYSQDVYRPTNALHIRNATEFSNAYNILYPVHAVATFEAPVQWLRRDGTQHAGRELSSSASSSSGSLTFVPKGSLSMKPSSSNLHATDAKKQQQKKKSKMCCGKPKKSSKEPAPTAAAKISSASSISSSVIAVAAPVHGSRSHVQQHPHHSRSNSHSKL